MKPDYHRRLWVSKDVQNASMVSMYGYSLWEDDRKRQATITFSDGQQGVALDIQGPAELANLIAELQNLQAWLTTGAVSTRPKKKPSGG